MSCKKEKRYENNEKQKKICYHSQSNRALAARLRLKTLCVRWVLPIAAGDFYWQNPLLSQHEGL